MEEIDLNEDESEPSESDTSSCIVCCDGCHNQQEKQYEICRNASDWCELNTHSFYPHNCPQCFADYQRCCGNHCADVAEKGCNGCWRFLYNAYCNCPLAIVGYLSTILIIVVFVLLISISFT
jgi:hypothetical protein